MAAQNIFWPISGLDEGETNPQLTQGTALLQDGSFLRNGSVTKRKGTSSVATPAYPGTWALSSYNNKLIRYGDGLAFHYNNTDIRSSVDWGSVAATPLNAVLTTNYQYYEFDQLELNSGHQLIVVGYTIEDNTSNLDLYINNPDGSLKSKTTLTVGTGYTTYRPHGKLFNLLAESACVIYTSVTGAWYRVNISATGVPSLAVSLSGIVSVAPNAMGGVMWDGVRFTYSATDYIIVVYHESLGSIMMAEVSQGTGTSYVVDAYTRKGALGISYWHDNSVAIMYTLPAAGNVYVIGMNPSGTVTTTKHAIKPVYSNQMIVQNIPQRVSDTKINCWIVVDTSSLPASSSSTAYQSYSLIVDSFETSGTTAHITNTTINGWMVTKPLLYGSKGIAWFTIGDRNSARAKTGVLLSEKTELLAKALPDKTYSFNEVDSATLDNSMPLAMDLRAPTNSHGYRAPFIGKRTSSLQAPYIVEYETSYTPNNYKYSGGVIFDGSMPRQFAGNSLSEFGFLHKPEVSLELVPSGTGLNTGAYSYVAVYEWLDELGNLWRSAPSVPATISTTSSDKEVKVYIKSYAPTEKSNVSIALYRTLVDGTLHYKDTYTLDGGYWETNIINDTSSDATIESNQLLYTDQGILAYQQIQPFSVGVFEGNRFFYSPLDTPNRIQYSSILEEATSLTFTGVGEISVGEEGGDTTLISMLGTRVIVMKTNDIYVYDGEGVNKSGSLVRNYQWGELPVHLSRGTGSKYAKAYLHTERGILFQSASGIELLTPDLNIIPIGKKVKYITDNQEIKGAYHKPDIEAWVWIGESFGLVYFYRFGAWAKWTGYGGSYSTQFENKDIYIWRELSSSSVIVTEFYVKTDLGSNYSVIVTTPWFSFNQVNGYARLKYLYLLGMLPFDDGTSLTLQSGYDFAPCWYSTDTELLTLTPFDYSAYYIAGSDCSGEDDFSYQPLQYRWNPHKQTCTSIRFQITIASSDIILTGLTFGVAAKRGGHRVGEPRRLNPTSGGGGGS